MTSDNGRLINGGNGQHPDRDGQGRFLPGCKPGPGNPHVAQTAALLDAVTPEDIARVVKVLLDKALAGDVAAIRELLDRCVGRPLQAVELNGDGWIDVSTPAGREAYVASVRALYGIDSPEPR